MSRIEDRPLITFVLVAYDQEQFIAEAVQGAFSQTYSPLEIILSDDCSPDRTFKIMQAQAKAYQGPHEVHVRRNQQNLGLIQHINSLMQLVNGELVVIAAGDDVSLPSRVARTYEEYLSSGGEVFSLFSNAIIVDRAGNSRGLLRRTLSKPDEHTAESYASGFSGGVHGSTHAWRRQVFDVFGPMYEGTAFEDIVIPFRSALLGRVQYIDEPLVCYREHRERLFDSSGKANLTRFRAHMVSQIEPHIQICRNRLSDLETVLALQPERSVELTRLQQITCQLLSDTEREKVLAHGDLSDKIRTICQSVFVGTPWSRIGRWLLTYLCPSLYVYRLNLYYWVRDSSFGKVFFAAGRKATSSYSGDGEQGAGFTGSSD